jgi:hypothetical protein
MSGGPDRPDLPYCAPTRHPDFMIDEPLTESELDAIEARVLAASNAPWQSFVEGSDHTSGDNFIRVGGLDHDEPDMYVSRDTGPASVADQDFIAHARQDMPRLLAEVRRLRDR